MTSGGTESILSAMIAYRNRAYQRGIEYPEMYFMNNKGLYQLLYMLRLIRQEIHLVLKS